MKYPDIFLANKAQSIIGVIQCVHDLKVTLNLNDVNTASFTCDKYSNGIENEYYESIEDLMLIFIPKYGWFEITVTEHTDGYDWYKEVSAESLEVELGQHILRVLQANSTEDDGDTADDNYIKVLFFNPLDVEHSLMHKILKDTQWKPGHIDSSLWHKSRSFDIENQDVYSFLTGDVSTQYNCLFQFDTFTKSVNAYDLDNYGEDTNIYMDMETLVQSIDISCNKDNIKTCLYVDGGENIDVRDVNINGTNKIYNFDYYKKYFKLDTRATYEQYLIDCETVKESEEYANIVQSIKDKTTEISEINYRMPSVSETVLDYGSMSEEDWKIYEQEVELSEVTNWDACGVWLLETRLQLLKDNEDLYQQDVDTYCKETSPNYADYIANHNLLVECEAALNTRREELNTAQNELEQLKQQKINLINSLAVENYFTDEQWEEISAYIREDTYSNDSYLVYATDSSDYVMETTQALYDAAAKELDKYCKPQYSFSSTIANLFKIPEFTDIKKDFTLGNFIRLGVDGLISKLRLIRIDIDFETEDIGVEYSDAIRTDDGYCDAASIQALASSVSSTVSFNKTQWNNGGYAGEYVDKHFGNGLNTGDIEISSKDGNLNINKSGILLTDGESLKQAKWLNNKLLFTKDGWATVEAAFGEIKYTDPLTGEEITTYGLIADAIIGNLLLGKGLVIANSNNTFIINENGLEAWSEDKNTVFRVNPNGTGTDNIMEIQTNILTTPEVVFATDVEGDAQFKGDISGSTMTSGMIKSYDYKKDESGICIDLNNNLFQINEGFDLSVGNMSESCDNAIRLYTDYHVSDRIFSAISLGRIANDDGSTDSIIHMRSDGYVRFGVDDGGMRFNYSSTDNNYKNGDRVVDYLLYSKNFKIDTDGNVFMNAKEFSQGGTTITSSQLTAINKNLTEMGATISTIDSRVTDLEKKQVSTDKIVSDLENKHNSDINTLTAKDTELQSEIDEIKETISNNNSASPTTMDLTTDDNGRIINIKTTYDDGSIDNTSVSWSAENRVTSIGNTAIKWDF